jgi:preprotein translocase subunit YajC
VNPFAQTGAAGGNPTVSVLLQVLQWVPLFVIIYFLLIRPQQQRQKQTDQMLKNLKKGDKVVTTGGIIGTVIGLEDTRAVLRIAEDTKVEFTKTAIVQVLAGDAQ